MPHKHDALQHACLTQTSEGTGMQPAQRQTRFLRLKEQLGTAVVGVRQAQRASVTMLRTRLRRHCLRLLGGRRNKCCWLFASGFNKGWMRPLDFIWVHTLQVGRDFFRLFPPGQPRTFLWRFFERGRLIPMASNATSEAGKRRPLRRSRNASRFFS